MKDRLISKYKLPIQAGDIPPEITENSNLIIDPRFNETYLPELLASGFKESGRYFGYGPVYTNNSEEAIVDEEPGPETQTTFRAMIEEFFTKMDLQSSLLILIIDIVQSGKKGLNS